MNKLTSPVADKPSQAREPPGDPGWIQIQLDVVSECLMSGIGTGATNHLFDVLDHAWRASNAAAATALVESCRRHPLHDLLLKDPYTERARSKPRGYPGDAVMLDYVYNPCLPLGTCAIGAQVFRATTRSSAARSVLARRDLLAHFIDRVGRSRRQARVLAVGCGHLREAAKSRTLTLGGIHELWALDHDVESLKVVDREHSGAPVQMVHATLRALLRGDIEPFDFDLTYAPSLFDYLDDATASKLVTVLFRACVPEETSSSPTSRRPTRGGGTCVLHGLAAGLSNTDRSRARRERTGSG